MKFLRCLPALATLAISLNLNHARAEDWPMFGRDRSHNAVSPETVAPPTDWDVGKYDEKAGQWIGSRNILWTARLGSQTFGDPVVADDRVWIGINNHDPKRDASVLAGFATRDGKPTYNYVSRRLPHTLQRTLEAFKQWCLIEFNFDAYQYEHEVVYWCLYSLLVEPIDVVIKIARQSGKTELVTLLLRFLISFFYLMTG